MNSHISNLLFFVIVCRSLMSCAHIYAPQEKINGASLVSPPKPAYSSELKSLKGINASHVALIPFGFLRDSMATEVIFDTNFQWWGEQSAGIKSLIKSYDSLGIKTMLKPHVWVRHQGWPGDYKLTSEEDWLKWEASYKAYILHYAKLAQEMKIPLYCIGTEFRHASTERDTFWRSLIKEVRNIYSGKITYAANWDNFEKIKFWDQLDFIGIDAYFPLVHKPIPTVDELTEAWQKPKSAMQRMAERYEKPVLFTEYGYQSMESSAGNHWEIDHKSGVKNEQTQANAYEALYHTFWHESWIAGGFFWKWFPSNFHNPDHTRKTFTPQGKQAEKVIAKYYDKNGL